MQLKLTRKQLRFLVFCCVILTHYVLYTLLVKVDRKWQNVRSLPSHPTSPLATPPLSNVSTPHELVAQRGNHVPFSTTIRNVLRSTSWTSDTDIARDQFGKLNVHVWEELCGDDIDVLQHHILFPRYPSRRISTQSTASNSNERVDIGERIFGFIHPNISGSYEFLVEGSSFEFWLSRNFDPSFSKLFARKQHFKHSERVKFGMQMYAMNKYYVEVLHKIGKDAKSLSVQWKRPGSSKFEVLQGRYISPMYHDSHLEGGQVDIENSVKIIPSIHTEASYTTRNQIDMSRAHLHHLPFMPDEGHLDNILPFCEYKPSYLVQSLVKEYQGVWLTRYSEVYPPDKTNLTRLNKWISLGNDILEESEALAIVGLFMAALEENYLTRHYKLKRIINVERKHDNIKGDRYLLELELQKIERNKTPTKSFRLSKYVYQPKGDDSLCIPRGYRWKKNATVHIVITVGGRQGKWVQHFINNVAEIYRETKDMNLNVLIMDFNSKDIDIQKSLEESGLPRYLLLHSKSRFHKTMGLQTAMEYVSNPDDIIFVCDLHLYLPVTIVDQIRKHCIQGVTIFNAVLARLGCGGTLKNREAQWEYLGYGPIAMFKSDWNRVGGMNVEKYRHKWGGEDWDILDRLLSAGYEIERLKIFNFFHFYHTKKGMWDKAE